MPRSTWPAAISAPHTHRPQSGRRYWRSYISVFWNALPWASMPFTTRVSVLPVLMQLAFRFAVGASERTERRAPPFRLKERLGGTLPERIQDQPRHRDEEQCRHPRVPEHPVGSRGVRLCASKAEQSQAGNGVEDEAGEQRVLEQLLVAP